MSVSTKDNIFTNFHWTFWWNPACIQEVVSHILQESSLNHPMPTHFNSMSLMIAHLWRNKFLISFLKLKPAPHIMNRAYWCIWMCLGVWYPYPSVCDILFFNHHTCLLGGGSSLVHSVYICIHWCRITKRITDNSAKVLKLYLLDPQTTWKLPWKTYC